MSTSLNSPSSRSCVSLGRSKGVRPGTSRLPISHPDPFTNMASRSSPVMSGRTALTDELPPPCKTKFESAPISLLKWAHASTGSAGLLEVFFFSAFPIVLPYKDAFDSKSSIDLE